MTNATALQTITTIDRNTLCPITWNVEHVVEHGENTTRQYGWTHGFAVTRPKGRRVYSMDVVLIGDVVVKHNEPRKIW